METTRSKLALLRDDGGDKDVAIHPGLTHDPGATAKDLAAATGMAISSVRYGSCRRAGVRAVRSHDAADERNYER
ncbi:MAG: hypothetical protein ABSE80_10635 [Halobacteriota archaeon]